MGLLLLQSALSILERECAPVAQQERASASGAEGWRFNSSRAHQIILKLPSASFAPFRKNFRFLSNPRIEKASGVTTGSGLWGTVFYLSGEVRGGSTSRIITSCVPKDIVWGNLDSMISTSASPSLVLRRAITSPFPETLHPLWTAGILKYTPESN